MTLPCAGQSELDRANQEKEVASSNNRRLEQQLTADGSASGDSELERLRSQVEVRLRSKGNLWVPTSTGGRKPQLVKLLARYKPTFLHRHRKPKDSI